MTISKEDLKREIKEFIEAEYLEVVFLENGENSIKLKISGRGMGLEGDDDFILSILETVFPMIDKWVPEGSDVESGVMDADTYTELTLNFTTDGSDAVSYTPPH